MQIISQFVPLPLADPAQGTAVAMGYFDGIDLFTTTISSIFRHHLFSVNGLS